MKINAQWHKMHPMPKNPTEEQRLKWHVAHARNCACREIPPALAAKIRKAGYKVPSLGSRTR